MSVVKKLAYVMLGCILVLLAQTLPSLTEAEAQAAEMSPTIKYVLTVDYPLGGKDEYLTWVKSVAPDLQASADVIRLTSYDNYYGASPNRFVEVEFADIEAATRYFNTDKLRAIMGDWSNYGINTQVHVLVERHDYKKH